MDGTLTLRLNLEDAVILRNALMYFMQSSEDISRPEIKEILDRVNLFIQINLRDKPLDKSHLIVVE